MQECHCANGYLRTTTRLHRPGQHGNSGETYRHCSRRTIIEHRNISLQPLEAVPVINCPLLSVSPRPRQPSVTSQIPPCPLYAIKRILTLEAVYAFFGGSLIPSYLSTVGTCEVVVGFGYRTVDTKFQRDCPADSLNQCLERFRVTWSSFCSYTFTLLICTYGQKHHLVVNNRQHYRRRIKDSRTRLRPLFESVCSSSSAVHRASQSRPDHEVCGVKRLTRITRHRLNCVSSMRSMLECELFRTAERLQ
ncbi:unnamed protein product [Somion occarium]|uniref:Uncharacterized protein n=1 Tax=Somion occarium TaxID=3059160 RepID=A0ABP1E3B1_9APHY